MKGYIYKWENKNNGKVYIGQTMNRYGYKQRWSQHRHQAKNNVYNNHFHHAIRKYGVDGFDKQVLETIESDNKSELKNILDELEVEYIKKYDSFNNGYNSTIGGEFNIFNSGDEYDKEKAILNQKSTRARNSIYKSIEIKTKYRLPSSVESLHNLYDEWDIRYDKYKLKYKPTTDKRSKMHEREYSYDFKDSKNRYKVKIYNIEAIDDNYIEYCINNDVYINIKESLNLMDIKVVKSLLGIDTNDLKYRYDYETTEIIKEINKSINNIKLTNRQFEIFNFIKKGVSKTDIGEILGITQQAVSSSIDKIANNIVKIYEEDYEEWYYLNIRKGKYKTCSKCGKVKLLQRFNKNSRRKDGYETFCRYC